jgi:tetratricopeptide (TPR) repeat protein
MTAQSNNLAEAFRLLHSEPARSEQLCRKALQQTDDPGARLLLAGALRVQGDYAGAFEITRIVALDNPNWPGAQFEHALAAAGLGRHAEALEKLNRLAGTIELPGLWRAMGDQYWAMGDRKSAEQEYLRHLSSRTLEPLVHEALSALQRKDASGAERALVRQVELFPGDVLALRHLAEILSAADRYEEAERLLGALLERAPSFALARFGLASVLLHDHRLPPALEQVDVLLAAEPKRQEYLNLKAEILARLGNFEAAAECLETLIEAHPKSGGAWSAYGNLLRTLGRREDCETAYRRAIGLKSQVGEAYWGLANLKTLKFAASDVADMRAHAQRMPAGDDRTSLLFALAKALEDQKDYEQAFAVYGDANAARRARYPHDRDEKIEEARRARGLFTEAFFDERQGSGEPARDPIFIVGMPRSGSTLVEQILASHSQVEGTMELIELMAMAKRLGRDGRYPEKLRDMPRDELKALGQEYLERARPFRKTNAPLFIDKMPNNFTQTGLIHLILPNAKIVDVRRHPLACGVSNFRQHWATGQTFAYDLEDIGAFYRSYVDLMAHFDAVLPGRVHRVIYEDLIAQPETETRRLLEACGLPFEAACLRFYENTRAVRTPSSEQVRQPINAAGLDSWRPFEPWLDPLKRALGPVLDAYPEAPPL